MEMLEDFFSGREPTGCIEIQHVAGKSTATRLFAKYPLKFISPAKAASSSVDVIWVYTISYGGGVVSGDSIFVKMSIEASCTAVLTTQASTKVYKAIQGRISEQLLQVSVGSKATFALLPDPVTCFSAARYKQVQVFTLADNANIILVDWLTSGRRERGEVWDFGQFKSTNQIFLEGNVPLMLDSMCLEQGVGLSIASRMQQFHVVAMLVILGPQLVPFRKQLEKNVQLLSRKMFNQRNSGNNTQQDGFPSPALFASCSAFGPMDIGLVVRLVATSTELVYDFLREHLTCLASVIGVVPYAGK